MPMKGEIHVKVIQQNSEEKLLLRPWQVYKVELHGNVIFEHEPGFKVLTGCERWGFHVWGTRAYSIAGGCNGRTPIVAVEGPVEIKERNGWKTIAYIGENESHRLPDPWLPHSLIARGSETVRKGTLIVFGGKS